jgi:hypothetical protein
MRSLQSTIKKDSSEPSKYKKKKPKKNNLDKINLDIDDWAFLEWTTVDSQDGSTILVDD